MSASKNPRCLREKYYGLEHSTQVQGAVRDMERRGEHVPHLPSERIQAYLDRLDFVLNPPKLEGHESFDRKARNVSMMKRFMHKALIIQPDTAAKEYLAYRERAERDRGNGDWEIAEDLPHRLTEAIGGMMEGKDVAVDGDLEDEEMQMAEEITAKIKDQKLSLDKWLDYFATDDARTTYPDWFRYWALRSITGLSNFDKDTNSFRSRDNTTLLPFPELDRAALGKVLDHVRRDQEYRERCAAFIQAKETYNKARQRFIGVEIKRQRDLNPSAPVNIEEITAGYPPFNPTELGVELPPDDRSANPEIRAALDSKDFARLYALEFSASIPITETLLRTTAGVWKKYPQGSAPDALTQAVARYQTGWCTAGEEVARHQLAKGDFYVYFSQNEDRDCIVPRLGIRMDGTAVAEVRGIAEEQNTDEYIGPIMEDAINRESVEIDGVQHELEGLKEFHKKSADVKKVIELKKKQQQGKQFTKNDLIFLYEIYEPIEGFGYGKYPRVIELRLERNPDEDILVVFECDESHIARSVDQINESTKAYVGKLEPGIFDRLPESVEHVYTKFPEGHVRRHSIEIGGKDEHELEELLERSGHQIYTYAKLMMANEDFKRSLREPNPKQPDWTKWKLKSPEEAKLIILSVKNLGFPNGATTDEIFTRAQEWGLELCPPEVGPQFLLQCVDQPMNESVYIGMKQISGSNGHPDVFTVKRDYGGSWLGRSWSAEPANEWDADSQFVFHLRKKPVKPEDNFTAHSL